MQLLGSQRITRPSMSSAEHGLWRELIHKRCGLHFTDGRLYFLEQRLWERMNKLKIDSYNEYYHFISFNARGNQEWLELRETILNNESSFFRHTSSYTALLDEALPDLMAQKRRNGSRSFTLWSAGCSGGQEPYSLAMTALERIDPTIWDIHVSGTDISKGQLAKAEQAHYKKYEVRNMPAYYRDKQMRLSQNGEAYEVRERVRKHVRFSQLNLSEPINFWLVSQDVIFCQNVLIYFTIEDRIAIINRLCERLSPGGYLFLGPAEVVGKQFEGMQLMRWKDVLVYQRSSNE